MGWFSNQNNNNDDIKGHRSESTSRITTRSCKQDPQDQNFLICTNKTTENTWIDGKRNTQTQTSEERVSIQPHQYLNTENENLQDPFAPLEQEINQIFSSGQEGMFGIFGPMFKIFNIINEQSFPHQQYKMTNDTQQSPSQQTLNKKFDNRSDIVDL